MIKRWALAGVILTFSLVRAVAGYGAVIARGGGDHQTADWLINYAGGFVRRGLFGEAYLLLTPPGAAGLVMLATFQVACYLVLVAFGIGYLRRTRCSWQALVLVCGPAALPFVGWDPEGAFRKEILLFLALALLGWARLSGREGSRARALRVGALAVLLVSSLTWEATVLIMPAWGWLLLARDAPGDKGPSTEERLIAVLGAGVAAIVAGLSVILHGDASTSDRICDSLRGHGLDSPTLCGGAIRWLHADGAASVTEVARYLPDSVGYAGLIALALLPLLTTQWFQRHRVWAIAQFVAFLPLYLIAVDYGRWVHMLVIILMICVASSGLRGSPNRSWTPPLAIAYLLLWGVPHGLSINWPTLRWLGFVQAALSLIHP